MAVPSEKTNIHTKIIGKNIIRYSSIESTNAAAKEIAQKGTVQDGTVILSKTQTKGRGRKDRKWFSPEGGLWFSVIIYPDLEPDRAMLVTMATSAAIVEGILRYCNKESQIKWPNDVLIDKKKVAGVLTELHAEKGRLEYMVVGVGVNVNNRLPEELHETATSIKREIDSEIETESLFKNILRVMDELYRTLIAGEYEEIRERWLAHTNMIGKKIKIHEFDSVRTGVVKGIDKSGGLLVDIDGKRTVILSGDIEIL